MIIFRDVPLALLCECTAVVRFDSDAECMGGREAASGIGAKETPPGD
jgi:hypothetical protein